VASLARSPTPTGGHRDRPLCYHLTLGSQKRTTAARGWSARSRA